MTSYPFKKKIMTFLSNIQKQVFHARPHIHYTYLTIEMWYEQRRGSSSNRGNMSCQGFKTWYARLVGQSQDERQKKMSTFFFYLTSPTPPTSLHFRPKSIGVGESLKKRKRRNGFPLYNMSDIIH